jgi:hypothetical protein
LEENTTNNKLHLWQGHNRIPAAPLQQVDVLDVVHLKQQALHCQGPGC